MKLSGKSTISGLFRINCKLILISTPNHPGAFLESDMRRMPIMTILLSALFVLPITTSAQTTNPDADMHSNIEANSSGGDLSGSDETFFTKAAEAGLAEIEGANMAQTKASTSEVKEFAARMITDHTKINEELKMLATEKDVTLPAEPSLMQKAELKALGLLDDKFDSNYVDRMAVAAHEDAVELFKDTVENSEDADIKAFAQKTLPALQEHLKMAKALNPTVSKTK